MSKKIHYEDIMEQGKDLISFYLDNPCIAAYDLLGVDMAPIQRLLFRDMWFKDYVIAVCGRGLGKTFLSGTLATLSCMLKPGYRVGLVAPAFRQSLVLSDSCISSWTSQGLQSSSIEVYNSIVPNLTHIQSKDCDNIVLSKWVNKDRACISINTDKGFELSGSIDHSILTLNSNLDIVYKELQDIRLGEYIVIKKGFNYFANDNSMPKFDEFDTNWRMKDCIVPNKLTIDLAYWAGLLVGDGYISVSKDNRKHRIGFVNVDKELLDSFVNYLSKCLINDSENICIWNKGNNTFNIEYYSKKLIQYLLKCGFTKTTALSKKIPSIIKKASKEVFIAFLQGLFDTDGSVYIQTHKHGFTHCEISFSTSSKQLAVEVHSVLLNLGIVSNLSLSKKAEKRKLLKRDKYSNCKDAYKIRITGKGSLTLFKDLVNFRCTRKKDLLNNYLENYLHKKESLSRSLGLPKSIVNSNKDKFYDYYKEGLYFVKLKENDYFFSDTFDIEVENEACYWVNGFINHNSKLIFAEVEKLYAQSSIFQEACSRIVRGTDNYKVEFKSVAGLPPSQIEAIPLGNDGSKIRGSRFYLILVDEVAQVPDSILDLVIRPFAAASMSPMEKVRRIEEQRKLISLGIAIESDFEKETVNKMIMTSSGYYKFNHMWRRMRAYWKIMEESTSKGEVSPYSVWQIPYHDLPEGFLDINNINEARRVMSSYEFRMEYEAAMVSDSEGFFKASLLDGCTLNSGFGIEAKGDNSSQYVIGVDPNQGGKASTGITVIKLGNINKIVNCFELVNNTTQQLTKSIQDMCESFNVNRIFMDKGGGGKAICDLLEEGYGGYEPIIDRTNDEHKHLQGRHILQMVNFNPAWISDANFNTKSLLEDKKLLFPEVSIIHDSDFLQYDNIKTLKSQMLNIIVTQTSTGILHFDTPSKGQNKDLYSSLILAAYGIKVMEQESNNTDMIPILHNSGGMIRLRNAPSKSFNDVSSAEKVDNSASPISLAVLKKKKK